MAKLRFLKPNKKDGEAPSLFRWFRRRTLHLNKNVILVVVGSPGSGKSYACLRIAEKMAELNGRKYDVNNCARDIEEFMGQVNSPDLKTGDVLIMEEVGVNVSSRDWAGKMNKLINYVFQTFRNKNLVVLLNVPDIRMLDSNTQRLLHGVIQPQGVDVVKKTAKITVKLRQHNFQTHKDYWKFLKVLANGKVKKVKSMTLNKPSDGLCELYEARRLEFTQDLNKRVEREIMEEKSRKILNSSPFKLHSHFKIWKNWHDYKKEFGSEPKLRELGGVLDKRPDSLSRIYKTMDKRNPNWRIIEP